MLRVSIVCWFLLAPVTWGCGRQNNEALVDGASNSTAVDKVKLDQAPSIVGTWEVVSVRYDDQEHSQFTGTRWTFDGKLAHEDYGDDFAHTPHGARPYRIELDDEPPQIYLESYGGCIVDMVPSKLELAADTLRFTDWGVLLTMRRVSHEPQPPAQSSGRAASVLMERVDQGGELSEIDGTWELISYMRGADRRQFEQKHFIRFSQGRRTSWMEQPPKERQEDARTVESLPPRIYFEIAPTTNPKQINLLVNSIDGVCGGLAHMPGIYKMEGDTLTILTVQLGRRPTSFESQDREFANMSVYKRVGAVVAPAAP